jgi:preprotein translocase subunit SecD
MKAIAPLTLGCLIVLAAFAANSSASQPVEVRLILDKPSADAEQMTLDQEALFVQKTVLLDQTDLRSVAVSTNMPMAHPQVGLVFLFTAKGAERLAEVTSQSRAKRLAVIIDGQIYAAPFIRHKITDGVFEFHGPFTEQKACDLSVKIDKVLQK